MGETFAGALSAATAAAFTALVLTYPVIRLLQRTRTLDVPTHRSSHASPTPRGAGLALVPAAAAGAIAAAALGVQPPSPVLLAAALFALIGMADDFAGLSPVARLLAQLAIAAAVMSTAGLGLGPLPSVAGALALAGYVNAFNFMDGINGISGFHAVVAGASFAVLGHQSEQTATVMLGAITIGLGMGFLPWNVPVARAFLGDSGSYLLGALIVGTAIFAIGSGMPLVAATAPMWIYAVDTAGVLVRRIARGDPILEPHREHVYQRLSDRLGSHVRAAVLVAGFSTVAPLLVIAPLSTSIVVVLSLILAAIYLSLPSLLVRVPR